MIYIVIYLINIVIRVLCAWGMFSAFASGNYLIAGLCFVGAMKRNWLVYNTKYGSHVYISADKD